MTFKTIKPILDHAIKYSFITFHLQNFESSFSGSEAQFKAQFTICPYNIKKKRYSYIRRTRKQILLQKSNRKNKCLNNLPCKNFLGSS